MSSLWWGKKNGRMCERLRERDSDGLVIELIAVLRLSDEEIGMQPSVATVRRTSYEQVPPAPRPLPAALKRVFFFTVH